MNCVGNNKQLFVVTFQLFERVFAEITRVRLFAVHYERCASYLTAVSKYGHIDKRQRRSLVPTAVGVERPRAAAESLHVTQPTLSKQLMDLEEELGCKLFERGKRKITLTEEGTFLRQRAQEIVDLADKTQASFKSVDQTIAGDIFIGCGETQGMRVVIGAMKKLSDAYPDIRFHIYSGNGEDVSERLEKGLVDFGLFVGNANLEKFDYVKLPIYDTWGLLMRKDSPLANSKTIRPKDLENILNCPDHETALMNVAAGRGITLSPGFTNDHTGEFAYVPFNCKESCACVLGYHKDDIRESARYFIELCQAAYKRADKIHL